MHVKFHDKRRHSGLRSLVTINVRDGGARSQERTCKSFTSFFIFSVSSGCPLVDTTMRTGLLCSISHLKERSRGFTGRSAPRIQPARGNADNSFTLLFFPCAKIAGSVVFMLSCVWLLEYQLVAPPFR